MKESFHSAATSLPLVGRAIRPALRSIVLTLAYASISALASLLAMELRFDFAVPVEFQARWVHTLLGFLPLQLLILKLLGQYRSLLTYFGFPDAKRLLWALAIGTGFQLAFWFSTKGELMIPRGVILVQFILSCAGFFGFRIAMQAGRERLLSAHRAGAVSTRKRVAIVGAGNTGSLLLREIESKPGLAMEVLCFIDDDAEKIGRTLHGRQVFGNHKCLAEIVERLAIDKCILAMPSASPAVLREIVAELNRAGVDHDILPSIDSILHRKVTVNHLRHVSPADLLRRPPLELDHSGLANLIKGRVVLVTGAGGSIGRELCRQIASYAPATLLLVERSEPALFAIEQALLAEFGKLPLVASVADVSDQARMRALFRRYKPELVFHAAAHKHVPLMESQPAEAIQNNILGTLVPARLAAAYGCAKFILVSSDKAVNPANVMGATKRMAELLLASLHRSHGSLTAFCAVRFGNVLDSSGSVIPVFRRQIAAGGPVTITHPQIERYFMSIPEAVGLILQSAAFAVGGETFVLEMGAPVKIQDLAIQMIELSGLVPGKDIALEYIGLRPGEKLFEEPVHITERIRATPHPEIQCIDPTISGEDLISKIETLVPHLHECPPEALIEWLAIPEFNPQSSLSKPCE